MIVDPPGTQLSHVSSPAKFVEVLDLICNIQVPDVFLRATEVMPSMSLTASLHNSLFQSC